MARRGLSLAVLALAAQGVRRRADSGPKWAGEPSQPSKAAEPEPARRPPTVLVRFALAGRWGAQGRFPVPAGGAARRQCPTARVGSHVERLRVRLLLLLASRELDGPRALSARHRRSSDAVLRPPHRGPGRGCWPTALETLRSWAYRTTRGATRRTRGPLASEAVRRVETALRPRGDCHRRRTRPQGDLPADQHRTGDHLTRSRRPTRRRPGVAGHPPSRRSHEVRCDPAQEHRDSRDPLR